MDPLRMSLFQTYPLQKVVPHVKTKIRVAISSMKNIQEFSGNWRAISVHKCFMGVLGVFF